MWGSTSARKRSLRTGEARCCRIDVAVVCEAGDIQHRQFNNTSQGHAVLGSWLKNFASCHIVLEATGSYHERLAQSLEAIGAHFSVVNPAQTSYFVRSQHRRNKTDKADALMLAIYAKERQPAPTSAANPLPQSIARELGALQEDITRLRNRLEAQVIAESDPPMAVT